MHAGDSGAQAAGRNLLPIASNSTERGIGLQHKCKIALQHFQGHHPEIRPEY